MAETEHAPEHASARRYVVTWVALLLLTALSFSLSFAHTGAWELPIALGIAVVKSVLVMLFFMHLVEQRFINAFVPIVSVGFAALLVSLIVVDVVTRQTFPAAAMPLTGPAPPTVAPPPPGGAHAAPPWPGPP